MSTTFLRYLSLFFYPPFSPVFRCFLGFGGENHENLQKYIVFMKRYLQKTAHPKMRRTSYLISVLVLFFGHDGVVVNFLNIVVVIEAFKEFFHLCNRFFVLYINGV